MGSVGTANMDYRSFRLNFEVNAFFYDADLGGRLRDVYLDDLTLCTPFDRTKAFGNRYIWAVKEGVPAGHPAAVTDWRPQASSTVSWLAVSSRSGRPAVPSMLPWTGTVPAGSGP